MANPWVQLTAFAFLVTSGCKASTPQSPGSGAPAEGSPAAGLPAPIYPKVVEGCGRAPGIGRRVEEFRLLSPGGDKTIAPEGYRGRVVLLNFWGTWCKPCLKELPRFDELYQLYRPYGMTLVAVATDEDAAKVQDFVAQHDLRAKVAIGGEEAAGAYGERPFPFSFVIDRDGRIVAAYDGYEAECMGQLEADVRALLQSSPSP